MALLIHFTCREPFGFASHFRGDPLLTNDVLYQLSYSGADAVYKSAPQPRQAQFKTRAPVGVFFVNSRAFRQCT